MKFATPPFYPGTYKVGGSLGSRESEDAFNRIFSPPEAEKTLLFVLPAHSV